MSEPHLRSPRMVITGVTGFVGGHLARRLSASGTDVRGAGRSLAGRTEGLGLSQLVEFDLLDPSTFSAVVQDRDTVCHLAAWMERNGDNPQLAQQINVDATRAMAEAARDAGVKRFVLVSTVAVYGLPESDHVTEETPLGLGQDNSYGRTKALGEQAVRDVAGDMEVVVLRPGMIHGPGAPNWTRRMHELVSRGTPSLLGAGDGHVFPVFIDNLLDAIELCATHPDAAGEAFHVTDGEVTWRAWMEHYGRMSGSSPRAVPVVLARMVAAAAAVLPLGIPLRPTHVEFTQRKLVFDTRKAREVLGWSPAIPLQEAMKRNEDWLRSEGLL